MTKKISSADIFILNKDGSRLGPYPATFIGNTFIINEKGVILESDTKVIKSLPDGKETIFYTCKPDFYNINIPLTGRRYELSEKNCTNSRKYKSNNSHKDNDFSIIEKKQLRKNINNMYKLIEKCSANQNDKNIAIMLLNKFIESNLISKNYR